METIKIQGGKPLNGTVRIGGAKNSALPLIAATLLANTEVTIESIPNISDISRMANMLELVNARVRYEENKVIIDPSDLINKSLIDEEVTKFRASYYFMGALLGKFGSVTIGFPGGCFLGPRPIDLHVKGFEALGAKVEIEGSEYHIYADELRGAKIYLDFASVGATINIMLAAVKAKGRTMIENAAREPEIVDVANLLNKMGAKIRGAGTETIRIDGVEELNGCAHEVIPDRIEAGTYIIAAVAMGEEVVVENIIPEHIESLISKLEEMGANIKMYSDKVVITKSENLSSIDVKTQVFPGFATDLQQPLTTLLTQADGTSVVKETIYTARFKHVDHLNNMGANIRMSASSSIVVGPTQLHGSKVIATDLRAGAAMLIAGLIADGVTEIHEIDHIERGYENLLDKLTNLGAKIWK